MLKIRESYDDWLGWESRDPVVARAAIGAVSRNHEVLFRLKHGFPIPSYLRGTATIIENSLRELVAILEKR